MQPQRQTMTDRLADVIHIIHIGGKSGVLTVERGEGKAVEEGFIIFVDGRIVEARVGVQTGIDAFEYINTWQVCRFALLSRVADEASSVYPPQLPPSYRSNVSDKISSAHTPTLMNGNESSQYRSGVREQSTPPLRLNSGEAILQQPGNMQLPRLHRRLLLLIDGQRGKGDLARLMARSSDEVQELLNDLERSGLIQQ